MKARGKVISLVTAILCLVPMFVGALGFGDQASAAIETINVTLHKRKMDDFPIGGIQNDGKEMADEFDKYEPLEGVTFSAYDITDDFYTALDKELKGDEDPTAYKAVVKKVEDVTDNDMILDVGPETAKAFEKGDLIHIFGYFKKREKDGKTYKNFVVKSYNKIEKKEENEEE